MVRFFVSALTLVLLAAQGVAQESKPDVPDSESLPAFNRIVLEKIKQYPTDGTHDYWWPRGGEGNYSGATEDLYFQGKRVMTGEPERRTYCCGLTLEVYLRSYESWLKDHGGEQAAAFGADDWPTFQKLWFVEKLNGPGPSAALERFQLGREIPPTEAMPGDFVQIWRTKNTKGKTSGHSVIFLDWVKNEEGEVTGFRYWSTQPGTKGISERIEYYGPFGGMSTENTHFARVEPRTNKETKEKEVRTPAP